MIDCIKSDLITVNAHNFDLLVTIFLRGENYGKGDELNDCNITSVDSVGISFTRTIKGKLLTTHWHWDMIECVSYPTPLKVT